MVGIYKFIDENDETYVGYSVNIEKRIDWHKSQRSVKDWEVIEECTEWELKAKEVKWIEYYDTYNNGLNKNKGGGGHTYLSEQQKRNISKGRLGIKTKTQKYNPIYQYNLDGEFIREWHNARQCSKELKINNGHLHTVLKTQGKKTMSGFRFTREKVDSLPPTTKNAGRKKIVIQYDKQGNMLNEYESAKHASRTLNLFHTGITNVCRGVSKTCGGFIFKYKSYSFS